MGAMNNICYSILLHFTTSGIRQADWKETKKLHFYSTYKSSEFRMRTNPHIATNNPLGMEEGYLMNGVTGKGVGEILGDMQHFWSYQSPSTKQQSPYSLSDLDNPFKSFLY